MKSGDGSTLSATVADRTSTDAPCRNRTYNLMIKSQILTDLAVEGTSQPLSNSSASLVQRTPPEDAPKFHGMSHGGYRLKSLLFVFGETMEGQA